MATVTPVRELRLDLPYEAVAGLCRRYGVTELAVFGSALRDEFGPDSDVDLLVRFEGDDTGPWMGKLNELADDLGKLLGRPVDLVNKTDVERSENYIRRRHILSTARVVYVA